MKNATIYRSLGELAEAIVRIGQAELILPELLQQKRLLEDALVAHAEILADLEEIIVPLPQRQEALEYALKGTIHPLLIDALLILQSRSHLRYLSDFLELFSRCARERFQCFEAELISAMRLSEKQISSIQKMLEQRYTGTVVLHTSVDSQLLGGFEIRIGEDRIDATITGMCKRLTERLSQP